MKYFFVTFANRSFGLNVICKLAISVCVEFNTKPQFFYTLTGASEPRNMAYMSRLGIWGGGTPFPDFQTFIQAVEKRYCTKFSFEVCMYMHIVIISTAFVTSRSGLKVTRSDEFDTFK